MQKLLVNLSFGWAISKPLAGRLPLGVSHWLFPLALCPRSSLWFFFLTTIRSTPTRSVPISLVLYSTYFTIHHYILLYTTFLPLHSEHSAWDVKFALHHGFFQTVTRLVQTQYSKKSLHCKQIQKLANICMHKERHGKGEKHDGSVCGKHQQKEKKERGIWRCCWSSQTWNTPGGREEVKAWWVVSSRGSVCLWAYLVCHSLVSYLEYSLYNI